MKTLQQEESLIARTVFDIDIVIINYRSIEDTLGAIAFVSPWRHGRIWVVDNSEDSEETAALSFALKKIPAAELLVPEKNLGFGVGCNLAYSHSSAEFLLLLNPDARIDTPNIQVLASVMAENRRWGALSPTIYWDRQLRFLLPPPFPMTPFCRLAMALATRLPYFLQKFFAYSHLLGMRRRVARQQAFHVSFLAGAVLMVRREAISVAGGLFDPAFFMFFEDTDLSRRLRKKGYDLGIVSSAAAVHGYRHKAYKLPLMVESEKIYYGKHFPFIYRTTRCFAWIARLERAMDWHAFVSQDFGLVHSAEELSSRLGDKGILAVSLSPTMVAAVFRPAGATLGALSSEDWERMEPGRYVLVVVNARQEEKLSRWRMISFFKH